MQKSNVWLRLQMKVVRRWCAKRVCAQAGVAARSAMRHFLRGDAGKLSQLGLTNAGRYQRHGWKMPKWERERFWASSCSSYASSLGCVVLPCVVNGLHSAWAMAEGHSCTTHTLVACTVINTLCGDITSAALTMQACSYTESCDSQGMYIQGATGSDVPKLIIQCSRLKH